MKTRIAMSPSQLKAFLNVADTTNFRKAAELSFVSQPALSRTILNMEAEIGARLFDRDTRNVSLTAVGRELLPMARRIVAEFDDSFSDLVQFVEGRSGRVVIGTLPSLGVHIVPAAIARFRTAYPDVQFRLIGRAASVLVAAVETGEADFALSTQPPPGGRLSFIELARDEFVLVCRKDDPLAQERALPWSTFEKHPLIATPPSSSIRPLADDAFRRAGLTITPAYECDGELSICGAMVRQGLGITAVPRLAMSLLGSDSLAAVPLRRPSAGRSVGIIQHQARSLSMAALRFRDQLVEAGD